MAFHNDSRVPLGPNMREKNEHLRPTSNKYASCLRIPEDTTWPKIPERRSHDNIVNNTKVPCVITLAGKPQKLRNIQSPNSQFMKSLPRKNEIERNNTTCNPSAFRTTAKERNTSTCIDSKFKTTITPQVTIDPFKNEENRINEEKEKEVIENFDHVKGADNCDIKNSCEINTSENKANSSDQINIDNTCTSTIKPSVVFNLGDFSSDKIHNTNTDCSQDQTNLKISNKYQDGIELNNNSERCTTNNDSRKEESIPNNKSPIILRENKKSNNCQVKYEWISEKTRPNRLYISDTTDSEVYSSDTTRTDQMKTIMERRIQSSQKKFNTNCCAKTLKYTQMKKENDVCSCTHYEKLWTSKKLAHHSEPQIGSSFDSRRCSTAHGKGLHCCAKDFHRVASDSDCRTIMYKSEIPRRCKEQGYIHDRLNKFHDMILYSDTLKTLRSRKDEESKHKEINLKTQKILETNFFNNFQKMYSKEKDDQMTVDAPQEKKRKCDNEDIRGCDTDTFFTFSSTDKRDVKTNSLNGADSVLGGRCVAKNSSFGSTKESTVRKNTSTNDSLQKATSPNEDENSSGEKNLANNRLLKLKRAFFFGSVVYALILSLPTLYDYFFYEEEYETYEEQTYIEVILEYIVSSFQETFGGFFDFISKIFFQSRTCRKCSTVH